jgi:hypothetical protein
MSKEKISYCGASPAQEELTGKFTQESLNNSCLQHDKDYGQLLTTRMSFWQFAKYKFYADYDFLKRNMKSSQPILGVIYAILVFCATPYFFFKRKSL